jgi:hypothetical protein
VATETKITVFRGEDISLNFAMVPVEDITGWTLQFSVAKKANSVTKLITKSGSIVIAASGTSTVSILSADLSGLEPGAHYWDYWRTNAGELRCLGFGAFEIRANARFPTS